jgi:hypothetical protein
MKPALTVIETVLRLCLRWLMLALLGALLLGFLLLALSGVLLAFLWYAVSGRRPKAWTLWQQFRQTSRQWQSKAWAAGAPPRPGGRGNTGDVVDVTDVTDITDVTDVTEVAAKADATGQASKLLSTKKP